jgi:hypothetical protein
VFGGERGVDWQLIKHTTWHCQRTEVKDTFFNLSYLFPVVIRGGTTQTEVTEQNKVDHKKGLNFLRQNSDVTDVSTHSVKLVNDILMKNI